MVAPQVDGGFAGARRGAFAAGALQSASHILGSASAGVLVAGLVGPYIAALDRPSGMPSMAVLGIAGIAIAFSIAAGLGAVLLRGLAHCAAHPVSQAARGTDKVTRAGS